jgi:signal peptidase I
MKKKHILFLVIGILGLFLVLLFASVCFVKAEVYPLGEKSFIVRKLKNSNAFFNFLKPNASSILNTGDLIIHKNPSIFDQKFSKKDNFCSRVIGKPGDIVFIEDTKVFVNQKPLEENYDLYYLYRLSFEKSTDFDSLLKDYKIKIVKTVSDKTSCDFISTKVEMEKIEKLDSIVNLRQVYDFSGTNNVDIFPGDMFFSWNKDNFGPVAVPQKGITVLLTIRNIGLYKLIIGSYEGNELIYNLNEILINGTPATEYTFKNDYYFVLNDNRYNKPDSRQWGFIPENQIVGKVIK